MLTVIISEARRVTRLPATLAATFLSNDGAEVMPRGAAYTMVIAPFATKRQASALCCVEVSLSIVLLAWIIVRATPVTVTARTLAFSRLPPITPQLFSFLLKLLASSGFLPCFTSSLETTPVSCVTCRALCATRLFRPAIDGGKTVKVRLPLSNLLTYQTRVLYLIYLSLAVTNDMGQTTLFCVHV